MTASQLPVGTVSFLFSDIEASTRLAESLAERWPAVLERHREIVRAALRASDGLEVQTEGDGFFAVFATAPAAVAATVQAQRDLAAEPWPADGHVRVRMGLHSGDGTLDRDGSYVGHDVHRAARMAGAAHGGQVLVSETTRALAPGQRRAHVPRSRRGRGGWCRARSAVERPEPGTAVRLAFALWRFWQQRGYLDEARGLLERMAEQGWQLEPDLRARVAETVGGVAYWQADLPAATRWYDAALEIRRHDASADDLESRRELARALYNRGFMTVAEVIQASTEGATPDLAATNGMPASSSSCPSAFAASSPMRSTSGIRSRQPDDARHARMAPG